MHNARDVYDSQFDVQSNHTKRKRSFQDLKQLFVILLSGLIMILGLCCKEDSMVILYLSEDDFKTKNEIDYVTVNGKPFFAIGYDTKTSGPWDGVSGPYECDGEQGILPIAVEMSHKAVEYGANFAYVWSYRSSDFDVADTLVNTTPQIFGKWHNNWGNDPAAENDTIPIIYNAHGESDMGGYNPEKIAEMHNGYLDFINREGDFSLAAKPNLPPVEQVGWYAWHPTWRMKGGGDGSGEALTDEQAKEFARTTNLMIGDTYTYVTNRWPSGANPITGQKGEEGEGYDYWLETDDPDHQSYFSASWDLVSSLVEKKNEDAVVWMWMQGHAFDDDIGRKICQNGNSDLWAKGPFPTMAYLRKEICSTIVAGGTGIIFFGYMYSRPPEAEKVRLLMRALEYVYDEALLSPEMDWGEDLEFVGEEGRAHLLAKWHEESQTIYIIGANPGAHSTKFQVDFPFSISDVQILDWETPIFKYDEDLDLGSTSITYTAPRDEGFILQIQPLIKSQ